MQLTIITGNLGRDPETKPDVGKDGVTELRVAASGYEKGEKTTTWYQVTIGGSRGEACAKYLHKGSKVTCSGDLVARPWIDKDGNPQAGLGLSWASCEWMDAKGDAPSQTPDQPPVGADDDIPF